jgi:uncharacterized protein
MRAMTVVTTVLVLAAIGAAPAQAQDPQTIAAPGIGRVLLTPDQAEIFLSFDRARPSSRAARSIVQRRINAIRRAVLAEGIAPEAIQTTGISVNRERFRRRKGAPVRIRFRASQSLEITSQDIPRLGDVIDAAAAQGADVFGPEFSFVDPSAGDVLATRAALTDARRRADDAAAQLGRVVTGVQAVDLAPGVGDSGFGDFGEDDSGGGASEGAGGGRTRVLPGQEEFIALVKVVYTLGPPS